MKFLILVSGLYLVSFGASDSLGVDNLPPFPHDQAKEAGDLENSRDDRVWIYKYDGSLQCEMDSAISPEKMRKELEGIKVYSEEKRSDGVMRTQECGTPSGQANLYEIDKEDIERASEKGFKIWKFSRGVETPVARHLP